jgi:hypothetical protein
MRAYQAAHYHMTSSAARIRCTSGVSVSDTVSDTDSVRIPYPYGFDRIGKLKQLKQLFLIRIHVLIRFGHGFDTAQPKSPKPKTLPRP